MITYIQSPNSFFLSNILTEHKKIYLMFWLTQHKLLNKIKLFFNVCFNDKSTARLDAELTCHQLLLSMFRNKHLMFTFYVLPNMGFGAVQITAFCFCVPPFLELRIYIFRKHEETLLLIRTKISVHLKNVSAIFNSNFISTISWGEYLTVCE